MTLNDVGSTRLIEKLDNVNIEEYKNTSKTQNKTHSKSNSNKKKNYKKSHR